ncbi:hypothetical protein AVEN_60520-1 [Araneus ventricosus]|uniref:Uncharacterized protein n=1 Tax=Araneus ventricosus TaxID=182803 RepID=A0A4Y2FRS0_ARAVE|nr:hypothetical protein AVEN_60520-1 [Araneus ventricosus]
MNLTIPRILCLETRLLATLFSHSSSKFGTGHWLPHMPRHCENTRRGIVKCCANSTTTAIIAVGQVKPFEVGRERTILSNPVSGMETNLKA